MAKKAPGGLKILPTIMTCTPYLSMSIKSREGTENPKLVWFLTVYMEFVCDALKQPGPIPNQSV